MAKAQNKTVQMLRHARAASVRVDTFDEQTNSVEVCFTTGADVLRDDWMEGSYIERLQTGPQNVRLGRLNAGAPFLDTHNAWELGAMIGAVVPGTARMDGGKGMCRVQLSRSERAADTVQDIRDGIINNVSVGYNVFAYTRTEASEGQPAVMDATDWEPCEISACPVPADPGAQIKAAQRSASGVETTSCIITPAKQEIRMADDKKPGDTGNDSSKEVEKNKSTAEQDKQAGAKAADDKSDAEKQAAEKAGVDLADVLKVDGNKVVTEGATPVVDPGDAHPVKALTPEQAAERAVRNERERVNTIADLAARGNAVDLGAAHIRAGTSVEKFRGVLMDKMFEARANDGGPQIASAPVEEVKAKNDREAGAAAARAVLRKPAAA